eukprot:5479568-Amphidinium_carterae.1
MSPTQATTTVRGSIDGLQHGLGTHGIQSVEGHVRTTTSPRHNVNYHERGAPVATAATQIADRDAAMSSTPSARDRLSTAPEEDSVDRNSS